MWQVVRHPEYNKAVVAVIMIMVAQQLTGMLCLPSHKLFSRDGLFLMIPTLTS